MSKKSEELDGIHPVSLFRHGALPENVPVHHLPRTTDVLVYGDDNIGLAAAIVLKDAGREVTVLARNGYGDNGSSNSFGHMMRQPILHDRLRRLVPNHFEAVEAALDAGFDWTAELARRPASNCDYRETEYEGFLNPFALNQALLKRAVSSGVTVLEYNRILRIDSSAIGHEVRTARGRMTAQDVVVTCWPDMRDLVPSLKGRLHSAHRQMVASKRAGDHLGEDRLGVEEIGEARVRRLSSGTVIGSLVPEGKTAIDAVEASGARPRIGPITHAWDLRTAVTPDGLPRVGQSDRIWYAVAGGPDALAMEGPVGAMLGTWVNGGAAPVWSDLPLARPEGLGAMLRALVP